MRYILLSEKSWHDSLFRSLEIELNDVEWVRISRRGDFTPENVSRIKPDRIFVPHWSYLIPKGIFESYECILFHMTDLPFGRGGSPLQNLIVAGYSETMISAIRVATDVDAGPIYGKRSLPLHGTAREIFLRSSEIIKEMIKDIHFNNTQPAEQVGTPTFFKRRQPGESDISEVEDISKLYDYIRMLDCDGYPPAFIETTHFRFEFTRASFADDKTLIADVRITKK